MDKDISILKIQFSDLLTKLNINICSNIDLIKALLICLISSHQSQHETASVLKDAHIDFGSCAEEEFCEVLPDLVSCFEVLYEKILKRPRRFLALFYHEQVVANWDGLQAHLSQVFPNENLAVNAVTVIYYFYCLEEKYREQKIIDSPYEFYLENKVFPNTWFTYELPREIFAEVWNDIFFFQLQQTPVRIGKELKSVISEYDKHHIPHSKILGDYAVVLKAGHLPALNEWNGIKQQLGQDREYGIAVDEGLFNIYATKLRKYDPTDVISALFYNNKKRNDSAFEVGVLTKLIYSHINSDNVVYLINPSPFMLTEMERLRLRSQAKCIICIVNGSVVRDIYQKQFSGMKFVSVDDDIGKVPPYDVALLTSRDSSFFETEKLLMWGDNGNGGSLLLACIPRSLLSTKKHADVIEKFRGNYTTKKVVTITKKATNTSPRNKLLICIEKTPPLDHYEIVLQDTELNGNRFRFRHESFRTISSDMFKRGTIKQPTEESKETSKRNGPKEVHFSKEISLWFTTKKRGNTFVGRGYYCQMLSESEQASRLRGKRLTGFIEKGLRYKTEEELVQAMRTNIPYYEEVAPFIIVDIFKQYQNRMGDLTLKTSWFCVRPVLLKKRGYDDNVAKMLFESNEVLADLRIGTATLDDYISLMVSVTDGSRISALMLWQQLNIIINAMVDEGFIIYNPVREHISTLVNRASKEQQEVRNALVKKTFTLDEERNMIQYVSRKRAVKHHDKKMFLKLYVIESLWLAPPIRLYTAISLREVCALIWGDFKEHKIGFCQFIITNVVDDKGQRTTHVASLEKGFRCVPIPQELALMLKERKRYLIEEKGIQEKDLIGMPIILENERVKKRFCRPHVAAKVCREIISAIGIAPNIVQLPDDNQGAIAIDLNRYYGDIFRSNYKYRANHTAMLDRGEINYILGIEPPDTYSQHYCDYLSDFTHFGMAKKLHRWAEQHSSVQSNYQFSYEEWESQETLYECVHSSKSGIVKLEESISIDPDENEEYIDITIYAQHGFIGEIDFLKGENMFD